MSITSTKKQRKAYLKALRAPPEALRTSHLKSLPIKGPSKSPIDVLSTDLLFCIVEQMDKGASVCFGLTSRKHYAVHWKVHGAVKLYGDFDLPREVTWTVYPEGMFPFFQDTYLAHRTLYGLIAEWMLDQGWKFTVLKGKFVKEAEWERIENAPWVEGSVRDCSD